MGLLEPRGGFGGIGWGILVSTSSANTGDAAKLEAQLDEGLEESFPASDSLAVSRSSPADDPVTMMRAVRVHRFGGPEVMLLERFARPVPREGQVLLEVRAAGVGPWDAWVRGGQSALPQPLPLTLGADLSGVVVTVGAGVASFKPGDEVYGVTNPQFTGAYAEYALAEATMIALKPRRSGFLEAASIPVVASTARQMVFDHGRLDATKRVLIHGAAGNVGAYAVQFAKRAGAEVIATAWTDDLDFVRTLHADQVIDARTSRFEDHVEAVDLVIDTVGGATLERSFAVLKRGGVLVSSVSLPDQDSAARHGVRGAFFLVDVTTAGLTEIAELLEADQLSTDIGEVLPLTQVHLAHEMLAGKAHRRGKIVLSVRD
jgi:NADPH:quinone reductase-like Zn-dependent oxidoreductase